MPPASSWGDLPRRILTVVLGVPCIILLLQNRVTSWLFFQGAHLICLYEWEALTPTTTSVAVDDSSSSLLLLQQYVTFGFFTIASIIITIIPTALLPLPLMASSVTLRLLQHIPLFCQKAKSKQSTAAANNIYYLTAVQHFQFGLLYLSIGFHFILQLAASNRGTYHIGNLLFVVWMSDTGALVCGRLMKRTEQLQQQQQQQAERSKKCEKGFFSIFLQSVSPGKTLYGLLGAILTGPISAMLYPIAFSEQDLSIERAKLGFMLSIAGIFGDLAESSVKRLSTKKDSGKLLPGHGGVVDRFDSLLSAAVVYYYCVLV
jgi:phosphatidate cytidylyltransferase